MFTDQEKALLKRFAVVYDLANEENWVFLGDLFLMIERPEGNGWFQKQFVGYPGIREILQKLLAVDPLLADRFASLNHWHGQAGKIRLVHDGQSERKRHMGIVSAIGNFADAFRNSVAQL